MAVGRRLADLCFNCNRIVAKPGLDQADHAPDVYGDVYAVTAGCPECWPHDRDLTRIRERSEVDYAMTDYLPRIPKSPITLPVIQNWFPVRVAEPVPRIIGHLVAREGGIEAYDSSDRLIKLFPTQEEAEAAIYKAEAVLAQRPTARWHRQNTAAEPHRIRNGIGKRIGRQNAA
jgi:hypothetical protein